MGLQGTSEQKREIDQMSQLFLEETVLSQYQQL